MSVGMGAATVLLAAYAYALRGSRLATPLLLIAAFVTLSVALVMSPLGGVVDHLAPLRIH